MEGRAKTIESRKNRKIKISVIPGHFATNHSHINNYIDMTKIKTSHMMAKDAAAQIAATYSSTPIDTIICMEGTEMLGAFLAESLASGGINQGEDVAVITPELNSNGQLIFRDNIQKMIWGKHVLLLISSVSTGKTINKALECLNYYSGELVAIASIFSAITESNGIAVHSVFTPDDIPGYQTFVQRECPMCQAGQKVDAIVNSFGYSKI
ncbi:MAG: orotate phosphoribosyltransferase [Oscillospiraceae bacterium]|nr:orotate phosphoribosyltransferase [Oscillospiraceae bacterium]